MGSFAGMENSIYRKKWDFEYTLKWFYFHFKSPQVKYDYDQGLSICIQKKYTISFLAKMDLLLFFPLVQLLNISGSRAI